MGKKDCIKPTKPVTCESCIYVENMGKGTGYCNHYKVKMLSPIKGLKPCVWKEIVSK